MKGFEETALEHIDSVPELETLMLMWGSRTRAWTVENVASRLYISPESARGILRDLAEKSLVESSPGVDTYTYKSGSEAQDQTMAWLEETYRRETVPMSTMIHSKASRAVLDFARAFRFKVKKERE